jgi:hypothetical protein
VANLWVESRRYKGAMGSYQPYTKKLSTNLSETGNMWGSQNTDNAYTLRVKD